MITPKQVSESLNVPSSTIRRWAVRFEDVLSKQDSKKRMYTMEDLDTFRKIRDYSKQGKSLDNIADKLKIVPAKVEAEQNTETGLIVHPEVAKVLNRISENNIALQLQLDKMKAQQDKQNKLIAWLMLPWWKRLFQQMPGIEQQENN